MRNSKTRAVKSVRSSIFTKLGIHLILASVIYIGLVYLFDVIFNGILKEFLYGTISYPIYRAIISHQTEILVAIYIVIIAVIIYRTISKAIGYIDIISSSLGSLLIKDLEISQFPAELKDVEISLRDIKRITYEKEQQAKEAEQRKNDLVVYLAHDLKTPLTSIIGYLTLMEESPDLPEKMREKYVAITVDKAYRLEELINEFFDITRFSLQSIDLENNNIDLTLMLYQIVDEFYPIFSEKGLETEMKIEPEMKIIGDAGKLARVFDNLLRNVVNYSYENTSVEIVAKILERQAVISILNHGDEISSENLERIFEKFFRADKARHSGTGGAGLGLAIAKQIVEKHGGTISATSNREGTRFIITLPTGLYF